MGKQWVLDKENYNESVKLTWLTCLFNEGFSQPMCKASLIFSWKDVEAVSRIEKQSSEHKDLHASDPLMCWKIWKFLIIALMAYFLEYILHLSRLQIIDGCGNDDSKCI